MLAVAGLRREVGAQFEPPEGGSLASAEESEVGPNVGTRPRVTDGPRVAGGAGAEGDAEAGVDGSEGVDEDGSLLEQPASRLHLWAGLDFTTAYCSRGFFWEDAGLVVQPWADVWLDVWQGATATASLTMGTWSSFHAQATDAGTSDNFREHWYECDLYAGLAVCLGDWTVEGRYGWYTSPSDAWDTIEEVYVAASYDDSAVLGAWALQPSIVLAIETGDEANDGGRPGTYLELGVEPGFGLDAIGVESGMLAGVSVSFPISVGLSLSNYYEGANGENDAFGFASFGVSVGVPLTGEGGGLLGAGARLGAWELAIGVQVVALGDAARSYNDDESVGVIGTIGVGVEF